MHFAGLHSHWPVRCETHLDGSRTRRYYSNATHTCQARRRCMYTTSTRRRIASVSLSRIAAEFGGGAANSEADPDGAILSGADKCGQRRCRGLLYSNGQPRVMKSMQRISGIGISPDLETREALQGLVLMRGYRLRVTWRHTTGAQVSRHILSMENGSQISPFLVGNGRSLRKQCPLFLFLL